MVFLLILRLIQVKKTELKWWKNKIPKSPIVLKGLKRPGAYYGSLSLCYSFTMLSFIMLFVHYAIRSLCYSFTMLSFIMLHVHYAIVHYATHSLCYQSLCYTFIMLFVHYAIVHYAIYSKFLLILWEILRHSNRNNFHRNSHFSMRFFNT